jgi:hypothetical protein
MLDSYYFAWSNLKSHATSLLEAARPALDKEARFRNDADRARIEHYQRAAEQLEFAMLRLDDSMMLVRDLC